MSKNRWWALWALALVVAPLSCVNTNKKLSGQDAGEGDQEEDDIPVTPDCPTACADGEFCSGSGTCIADGTCNVIQDCGEGMVCDAATTQCVPGSSCGSVEITGGQIEPNLFISLDRSCSMKEMVGTKMKWTIVVDALKKVIAANKAKIRWGLGLFPDVAGDACTQSSAAFSVGLNRETAISTLLTNAKQTTDIYYPDGPCVTNIDTAMAQAAKDPSFVDKTRKGFVLLATDGKQANCAGNVGDAATAKTIADLNTQGVKTFVVGFGSGVDTAALNTFADNGGVANGTGAVRFYPAEDQPSLDGVLAGIAKKALGCTYALTEVPPDPNAIFVFFDNVTQISKDTTHATGWDYDATANQVTIYGPPCDALKAGQVQDVDIVFGCAAPN